MSTCQTSRELNIFDASRACGRRDATRFSIYNVETISIMSTIFRPYLIAILVLIWAFDIWQQGLLQTNGSARYWRLYGAGLGLTYALVSRNQWALALAFTVFALTWSRLPDTQSNVTGNLPSFTKFIRSLPDAKAPDAVVQPSSEPTVAEELVTTEQQSTDSTAPHEPTEGPEEPEEPTCIVCWSSSDPPKDLPCTHLICLDCLTGLAAGTQNHCPLCRLPLFTRSNASTITTYRAIASIWNTDIAIRALALALQIHKWDGWSRSFVFDATWVVWQTFYGLWTRKLIVEGGGEWWRTVSFARLDGGALWRQPIAGVVLMGLTLAMKMHEVLGLDEKMVMTKID